MSVLPCRNTRTRKIASCLCLGAGVAALGNQAEAGPEIDAGDTQYTFDPDLGQYIDTDSGGFRGIYDSGGVRRSYHPIGNGSEPWAVVRTAEEVPYAGDAAWHALARPDPVLDAPGRSENIICRRIGFGDTVYFSFAFKVRDSNGLDGDRDGVAGFREYAFGMNAGGSDTGLLPHAELVREGGEDWVEMSLRRRTDNPRILYRIEGSADLKNWSEVTEDFAQAGPVEATGTAGVEAARLRYGAAMGAPGAKRYFRVNVGLDPAAEPKAWVFPAQLWQSGAGTPPVFLAIRGDTGALNLVKRDFWDDDYAGRDGERTVLWDSLEEDGWVMEAGKWYHLHLTLKPGRDNDGIIRLRVMNHRTGLWESAYDGTNLDDVGKAYPPEEPPEFKFKLGGYCGRDHRWSALYDCIRYADTWDRSLRGNLIGYARKILDVGWKNEEQSQRGNHLTSKGNAHWEGTWLHLDGDGDYAAMEVPTSTGGGLADFDVGNRLRIETHFVPKGPQSGAAGIFYAHKAGEGEGYGIVVGGGLDKIHFVVGHPDGTATWMTREMPVKVDEDYWVTATYNRFGVATVEIVEDGVSLGTRTYGHAGKPVAQPEQVWVGRRKSFTFNGIINAVRVYNNEAGGS